MIMKTREEEIKEAKDKICEFKAYPFNRGFIAGVQWADEHPKNPWRDAAKDPPKEMNIDHTSDAVIVFWQGGEIGSAIYNHDWNKWVGMHYGEDVATPLFWMPVLPLPKGGEK